MPQNIIRMKQKWRRLTGHVAHMVEMIRYICILIWQPDGKKLFGR
jgi:hypothetical protein